MNELDKKPRRRVATQRRVTRQRVEILRQVEDWLELPMVFLGFVWLILLVIDLTRGLNPFLGGVSQFIWIVFILDFALTFTLAPRKLIFLRHNVLTLLSLLLPALRVFRLFRALRLLRLARTARGLRLVRTITAFNRGMRALSQVMGRRGVGYILLLTLIVIFAGAAGMYAFEKSPDGRGLNDYGSALWWTAMLVTSIGSDYWPQSAEGRILCFLLSVYTITIFGYLTAALASFFIGRDAESSKAELAGQKSVDALRAEIKALREEIRRRNT